MWIFSILFLPILFCLFNSSFYTSRIYRIKKAYVIPVLLCIVIAILYCAIDMLLIFSYRNAPASFLGNFLYLFIIETAIPMLAITLFYLLFVKQKIIESLCSISNLFFAFFSIYLPYRILTRNVQFSSFLLFYKPVLYGVMFVIIQNCLLLIVGQRKRLVIKHKVLRVLLYSFFTIIALCVPTVTETFYYIGVSRLVWLSLFVFSCLCGITSVFIVLLLVKPLDNTEVVINISSNNNIEETTVNEEVVSVVNSEETDHINITQETNEKERSVETIE